MSIKKAIEDGLVKLPDSKELWIHPKDREKAEQESPGFIESLNLKVRVLLLMPVGEFVLSEKDMDEEIKKLHRPPEEVRVEFYQRPELYKGFWDL